MHHSQRSTHDPGHRRLLLLVDGLINLALGVLLIAFPRSLVELLGVPETDTRFYPTVLGGVLFGVGLALLIERARPPIKAVGLGLGGAIAINLCGGAVLAGWLVVGELPLPARGRWLLWGIVAILVCLSGAELYFHRRRAARQAPEGGV